MAATTVWELVRSEELVALVGCDGDELMWQDETDVVGMDCKAALVGPAVRIVAPVLSPEYESGCTTGSRSADAADAAPERSAARKPNSFSGEGDQGSAAGVSRFVDSLLSFFGLTAIRPIKWFQTDVSYLEDSAADFVNTALRLCGTTAAEQVD